LQEKIKYPDYPISQFENAKKSHVLATGRTSEAMPLDHMGSIVSGLGDYN